MNVTQLEQAQVNLFLEIDGEIYLVGMNKERLEAVTTTIKMATEVVIPTGRSQQELRVFLGVDK